jgi:hypothetical protein
MTTGAPTPNMPKGPLFLRYTTELDILIIILFWLNLWLSFEPNHSLPFWKAKAG